ncbi:MAG: nucleoside/nucleotide kinase family protein [Hyphomicrobiales bacterium]
MQTITLHELGRVIQLTDKNRIVIAIAGAPASGKSTIAEELLELLNENEPDSAAVVPMDGFHLDDQVLKDKGLLGVKGAPSTFDVGGFRSLLQRLKINEEPEIIVPVFDRELEISRAGARVIASEIKYIIVEGNYLLLDQIEWKDMQPNYDLSVFVKVSQKIIHQRLVQRWQGYDYSASEIEHKINQNDMPNAQLVMRMMNEPDYFIDN